MNKSFDHLFPHEIGRIDMKLCGNCLGCVYAVDENKLCGETTYCSRCNIRKAIGGTIHNKQSNERQVLIREFYEGDSKKLKHLVFSTKYIKYHGEDMGLVIVDDMTETEILKMELEIKNRHLNDQKKMLQSRVSHQTDQIKKLTISIVSALENANRFHDMDTGKHIKRVSEYSAFLAEKLGCDYDYINKIRLYASLHDIGKVGMPDNLLKKEGRYSVAEFDEMKEHVTIGLKMLENTEVDEMAKNIVYYHHCKFDGSGYVSNKCGVEIPLEARIVALADVYDALTSERCYKVAYSDEKAEGIIRESRGRHFDPDIVDVFFEYKPQIEQIKNNYESII